MPTTIFIYSPKTLFNYEKDNLLFLSFFLSFSLNGQVNNCGTQADPSVDYYSYFQSLNPQGVPVASSIINNIPLNVVIVADDNGVEPILSHSIHAQVEYANSLFTNGMQFYVCDITIVNSTELTYLGPQESELDALYFLEHVDDAVNVYFVTSYLGGDGVAWLPNAAFPNNGVFITSTLSQIRLPVLTHELGHYFGLLHTFECAVQNSGACPAEFVDGTNCATAGDFICDTPAQGQFPGGSCATNSPICDQVADCTNLLPGGGLDPNGDLYVPNPRNVMSYYWSCTNKEFTPNQLDRMLDILHFDPNRNFLVGSSPNYCESILPDNGNISRYCKPVGDPILEGQNVTVTNISDNITCEKFTNENGNYSISNTCNFGFVGTDDDFRVAPKLYDPSIAYHDAKLGVNTIDFLFIQQYILGISNFLDTPYKLIAADVNGSGGITSLDLFLIRRVILALDNKFPIGSEGATWRFVPSYYLNSDPSFNSNFSVNPFSAVWQNPSGGSLSYFQYMDEFEGNLQNSFFSEGDNWSFRAIKIGDVNCNAAPSNGGPFSPVQNSMVETRNSEPEIQNIENDKNECLVKGSIEEIKFKLSSEEKVAAYQLGLWFDNSKIKIKNIRKGDYGFFTKENFNHDDLTKGEIKTLWWNQEGNAVVFSKESSIFSLEVEVLEDICNMSELFKLRNDILNQLVINLDGESVEFKLFTERLELNAPIDNGIMVNIYPNPSDGKFNFEIYSEYNSEASIIIYDQFGNSISKEFFLKKGNQFIRFDQTSNLAGGLLFYSIQNENKISQGKILKIE